MLIDNKTPFDPQSPHTLIDFFKYAIENGEMDVVTGYFSVAALAEFYEHSNLNSPLKFRLILGDLVYDNGHLPESAVDILLSEPDTKSNFFLRFKAQKAIDFLSQDKVEVRNVQKNFCHAKVYLFRDSKDRRKHFHAVGSSNMTGAGLGMVPSSNVEMNTVLSGGEFDYVALSKWFNELWLCTAKDVIEIPQKPRPIKKSVKEFIIDKIRTLCKEYTPQEIYHRILYALFKDDILILGAANPDLTRRLEHLRNTILYQTLFPFQQRGVLSLIKMLQQRGGAILADAVGLGKTWQALAVMKFFQTQGYEILLLCPKKLEENWTQYLAHNKSKFKPDKLKYYVRAHTDLQDDRLDKYKDQPLSYFQGNDQLLVVIDESHNLRNDKSGRYEFLVKNILSKNRDVKVLMLSATPINNNLKDIRNQFKLMVKGEDNGFKGEPLNIPSLETLFGSAEREYAIWSRKINPSVSDLVQKLSKLSEFTDNFIVARTRKLIEKFPTETGIVLQFPKRATPQNEFVNPQKIGNLATFDSIISLLEKIELTAYRAAQYTKEDTKVKVSILQDERKRQGFLVRMMFVLMLKRLESSWSSFHKTIKNILAQHNNALEKVNQFIAAQRLTDEVIELSEADMHELEEVLEETEAQDALDATLGKRKPIALSDIHFLDKFKNDLEQDCTHLTYLLQQLNTYQENLLLKKSKDHKLSRLIEIIRDKKTRSNCPKVIIFTTYADTANYLYKELQNADFDKIACVSGQESSDAYGYFHPKKFTPILEKFAPYTKLFKERDWSEMYEKLGITSTPTFEEWAILLKENEPQEYEKLNQPIDILIATDCLSEGQNLQDCDCIINYDIHWNPVRLIQRMGRIDRIGSPHGVIFGINFWPAENYDKLLELKKRVERRMALMTLVGSETSATDQHTAQEMADHPLMSQQEERMMEQLQTSWEDIDTGEKTFGLDDLSKEEFRQELLELFARRGKELEQMPMAVYSGLQSLPEHPLPNGMIALLGYPKKELWHLTQRTKYQKQYLAYVCNDKINFLEDDILLLQWLRLHKNQPRIVPLGIDAGETDAIMPYHDRLSAWMDFMVDSKATNGMLNDFDELSEDKFQANNFDLVCWMVIS